MKSKEAWVQRQPNMANIYQELGKSHVKLSLRFGFQYSLDSQSEGGGTVTVHSQSSRGGRVPVKVIAQWKEGIEVGKE